MEDKPYIVEFKCRVARPSQVISGVIKGPNGNPQAHMGMEVGIRTLAIKSISYMGALNLEPGDQEKKIAPITLLLTTVGQFEVLCSYEKVVAAFHSFDIAKKLSDEAQQAIKAVQEKTIAQGVPSEPQ